MLRTSTSFVALLFLAPVAIAQPEYSACVEADDPPSCVARIGATHGADAQSRFEAIARHGLLDLVPSLRWSLRNAVGPQRVTRDDKPLSDKTTLAAVALLTAARHEPDPFSNPAFKKLAANAPSRAAIPFVAIRLWLDTVEGGNTFDTNVPFAGMPKIFEALTATESLNQEAVADLAASAAWHPDTRHLALPLLRRAAARRDLSAEQKIKLASNFARIYDMADEADRLMRAGGSSASDWNIPGVQASIAAARLKSGYDAASARTLVEYLLDNIDEGDVYLNDFNNRDIAALEQSGARAELREVARAYASHAAKMGNEAGEWLAFASDCYLRAGDRDQAIQTARLGLGHVPAAVMTRVGLSEIGAHTPGELASLAQGLGTAPVIALYRAGAIAEALEVGYLAGKDRYLHAPHAGEQPDPQWVLDDNWPLYWYVLVGIAIRDEPARMPGVRAAIEKRCQPLNQSTCDDELIFHLAHVAAASGDRQLVHAIFSKAARELAEINDGPDTQAHFAIRLAARWAHARLLLDTPTLFSPTP